MPPSKAGVRIESALSIMVEQLCQRLFDADQVNELNFQSDSQLVGGSTSQSYSNSSHISSSICS